MTLSTITILLADDHPLVVDGIKGYMETYDHLSVIATAGNAQTAVDLFSQTCPDVVIMDINMPGMNGLTATEMICELDETAKVIVLSMHDSPEYISTALRHGAKGYLLKDVPTEEIVQAVETVMAGGTYLCESAKEAAQTGAQEPLTSREQTVLLQLAAGASNKEVARVLNISVRTVEIHRANIKRKLGISSTAGLTRYALERGVLQV